MDKFPKLLIDINILKFCTNVIFSTGDLNGLHWYINLFFSKSKILIIPLLNPVTKCFEVSALTLLIKSALEFIS